LLKPFGFERFLSAVNKIILKKNAPLEQDRPRAPKSAEATFIFFKADKKIHKHYFRDILFIEGSGNYVKVYTLNNKPLMVLDKLIDLQDKLPEKRFIRVHKSFIVNASFIETIEGNMIKVDGKMIPVSATFKYNVEQLIKENK
jgi:DNA-binding LytR/AlgR family response regulator